MAVWKDVCTLFLATIVRMGGIAGAGEWSAKGSFPRPGQLVGVKFYYVRPAVALSTSFFDLHLSHFSQHQSFPPPLLPTPILFPVRFESTIETRRLGARGERLLLGIRCSRKIAFRTVRRGTPSSGADLPLRRCVSAFARAFADD